MLRRRLEFTFPLLAQIGFPWGNPEPAQKHWESVFQECWEGGNPFLRDGDQALPLGRIQLEFRMTTQGSHPQPRPARPVSSPGDHGQGGQAQPLSPCAGQQGTEFILVSLRQEAKALSRGTHRSMERQQLPFSRLDVLKELAQNKADECCPDLCLMQSWDKKWNGNLWCLRAC